MIRKKNLEPHAEHTPVSSPTAINKDNSELRNDPISYFFYHPNCPSIKEAITQTNSTTSLSMSYNKKLAGKSCVSSEDVNMKYKLSTLRLR